MHAPLKKKRIGKRKSPWITSHVVQKIRERDYLKRQFDITRDDEIWLQYKKARNETNNTIRQAKHNYFITNIEAARKDPRKTWRLVNDLNSRKVSDVTNVKKVNLDGNEITNAAEISDAFNSYFTSIGEKLANKIPCSNVNPVSYIQSTHSVFSFEEIGLSTVNYLLKTINANKATGPDNIPGRLLKIDADILSPSLTKMFNRSLSMGIYPNDWTMAKVLPIFKNCEKCDLVQLIIVQFQSCRWLPKFLVEPFMTKKVSSGIGALKRMRDFITTETAIRVYQSLVEPYFSYCAPVWDGLGKKQSEKLQKLQNRAARVITRSSYDISSSSLLEELNLESLSTLKRLKQKAILMFNTINKHIPFYLQEMFSLSESVYNLRDSYGKLYVPKPRTDCLKRSFSYSGASLWNGLPESLRSVTSLAVFKTGLEALINNRSDSHTAIR